MVWANENSEVGTCLVPKSLNFQSFLWTDQPKFTFSVGLLSSGFSVCALRIQFVMRLVQPGKVKYWNQPRTACQKSQHVADVAVGENQTPSNWGDYMKLHEVTNS